jgi:hypothetical protein
VEIVTNGLEYASGFEALCGYCDVSEDEVKSIQFA